MVSGVSVKVWVRVRVRVRLRVRVLQQVTGDAPTPLSYEAYVSEHLAMSQHHPQYTYTSRLVVKGCWGWGSRSGWS